MITLRDLVRTDRALAAVTTDECRFIGIVLDLAARSWVVRLLLPREVRRQGMRLRMLAATFGRTQPDAAPSLQRQIALKMEADRAKA